MTREKAIKALKWFKEYNEEDYCGGDRIQDKYGDCYYLITEQDFEAFEVAIKALEQETVSKESYDHEYFLRKELEMKIAKLEQQLEEQAVKADSILEKIREEIKVMTSNRGFLSCSVEYIHKEIDNVFDKYKAESENP